MAEINYSVNTQYYTSNYPVSHPEIVRPVINQEPIFLPAEFLPTDGQTQFYKQPQPRTYPKDTCCHLL